MKKSILIIFACVICVFLFQAFSVTDRPQYKNLQILPEDISEHDLDSVMHHFTQSLGQKCNFCHVRNEEIKKMDFASDDKPEKNIARKMMQMAIDINKNYFAKMKMDHDMDDDHMEKMEKDEMGKMDNNDSMKNHMENNMSMAKMDSMGMNDSRYMLMAVNCYTCHRGDAHPNSKLPPRQEGPPPPQPKPAENK